MDFKTAFEQLTPSLLEALGLVVAMALALLSFTLALTIGMLVALGRLSKVRSLHVVLIAFLEIVRGTPLLVQLLYVYYVLPEIISYVVGIWVPGYHMNISAFTASIVGLGVNYGCYLSEVFRSSIQAIDKGNWRQVWRERNSSDKERRSLSSAPPDQENRRFFVVSTIWSNLLQGQS